VQNAVRELMRLLKEGVQAAVEDKSRTHTSGRYCAAEHGAAEHGAAGHGAAEHGAAEHGAAAWLYAGTCNTYTAYRTNFRFVAS